MVDTSKKVSDIARSHKQFQVTAVADRASKGLIALRVAYAFNIFKSLGFDEQKAVNDLVESILHHPSDPVLLSLLAELLSL